MIVEIPNVLGADAVQAMRRRLATAEWIDGRATAGHQGSHVKHNRQLAEGSPLACALGDAVLAALETNALFISAALPSLVYPPLFNRYESGETFGNHIDNAVRLVPGAARRLRTDLSATLFLADPDAYDGGELLIDDTCGAHAVKLPAGHLVLYEASSVHRVEPVTRGVRLASFFWVQSMVASAAQRALLFDLDTSIRRLTQTGADADTVLQLTGCYHNLLRLWAQP